MWFTRPPRLSAAEIPNALYAIDLSTPEKNVTSFPDQRQRLRGFGGVAIGPMAAVYGLIPDGQGSVAGKYNNTVVALGAKDLTVKDYFTPSGAAAGCEEGLRKRLGATPAVFQWNGKDVDRRGWNGRADLSAGFGVARRRPIITRRSRRAM